MITETQDHLQKQYKLASPGLPLAVYREVAAHLRQVAGVETGLILQTSEQFDYNQSQIGSLWVAYRTDLEPAAQQQVAAILAYYGDRYAAWEQLA